MRSTKVSILALDPGGTTGCATFSGVLVNNEYLLTEYEGFAFGPEEHHKQLWGLMVDMASVADQFHIVSESFEYRNESRRGLNLMSREYIGVAKVFASLQTNTIFSQQGPGMAKTFVKDDNLRKLGVYSTKKDDRHEMDAYRHLFHYMIHRVNILKQPLLELGWK